ncbi:phage major capsid protein [uncultured Microbacterium sp.]|uniref:phage major capsid protein n=1 Tax=uncultured Microbacterium sp. TaxID=191216 RepID=UPI0025FFF791|nr:phage major capsid protein [uncultured Microbacterium sp.]
MNLKDKLTALLLEARELGKKNADDLTTADMERIPALTAEIAETKSKIDAQDAAASNLKDAFSAADRASKGTGDVSPQGGSRAEQAAGFAAAFKTQVREQLVTKAMVPNQTVTIDYSAPLVSEPKPALTLLSLISFDSTEAPATGAYLRHTIRENNAATVAAGAKKPTSRYELESVPWEMSTIAHLTEPIRKQWLSDFSQLEPWLSVELAYGLTEALQTLMLDGGVTENGSTVKGLDTVTGTNTQVFSGNMFRSLRLALGDLETAGVLANGIALHPDDWTEVELAEDANDRPLTTPLLGDSRGRYLWNTPVVVSPQIEKGTAWVGDFKSIVYRRRGPVEMTMTDKGVYEQAPVAPDTEPKLLDLYEHNLLRARAETRAVFQFLQPASLTKVDLTA